MIGEYLINFLAIVGFLTIIGKILYIIKMLWSNRDQLFNDFLDLIETVIKKPGYMDSLRRFCEPVLPENEQKKESEAKKENETD